MDFPTTRAAIDAALAAGAFPAVAVEVGRSDGPVWTYASGVLGPDPTSPATTATIFDLASLTKVMATASLLMQHLARGRVTLDTPVSRLLEGWNTQGRELVQLRHLLDHSSGLPAHARFWERMAGRPAYETAIGSLPLTADAGTVSTYSDPGFILLGFILEELGSATIQEQFSTFASAWSVGELLFKPPYEWRSRIAATEVDPWRGRLLRGEVHDENAAALGSVAGHAGLFGSVAGVGGFAQLVLRTFRKVTPLGRPELMQTFATRTGVPGSSRALAWDTMLPTSSCGTRLSATSIGHTGFTGTSLWIDPDRDLYVVLLTNRVHPSRSNDRIVRVRPQVHDAVIHDLEGK
ncbi:MAG: serine hydrolase domain-containing protein [Vicinamibacterales bacterium]